MSDLEVDDSSKSLIASWFGIDSLQSKNTEDRDDPVFSSENKLSKKKRKENDSKEKNHEVHNVSEENQKLQIFTTGLPQKKTMSTFVGEKLQKKLTKLKHRKENAEKDVENHKKMSPVTEMKTAIKVKKKNKEVKHIGSDNDDDDCSKVKVVKKTKKEVPVNITTVDVLKKTLNEDKHLSKNQRKRIKKKIQKLLLEDEKGITKIKESKSSQVKNSENMEKTKEESKTKDIPKASKNSKTEKDEMKVKTKNDSKDKTDDWSQKAPDSGENIVEKKKRKKKTIENFNDSTMSNISITNDIAVIESPKKKIKSSQSAKDSSVSTNTVSKHEKKRKEMTEKRDKTKGNDILTNGSMRNTGEVTQNDRKKKKNKNTNNGSSVSIENNSSEGSLIEESSVDENIDTSVKSKHKNKKLKNDDSSEIKLKHEQTGHMNVKNKHRKKEKLKDKSHIELSGDRISDNDDSNDNNDNDSFCVNNNVVRNKHKLPESISEATSPKKRNIETDNDKSIAEDSTLEGDIPRKKKRHKTRSKQKNIKKDHRPEHMKPSYLQQSTKQETKDNDD